MTMGVTAVTCARGSSYSFLFFIVIYWPILISTSFLSDSGDGIVWLLKPRSDLRQLGST